MSIDSAKTYEALIDAVVAEGTIRRGQILKGDHTIVANHESLWVEFGTKDEAEKTALRRAISPYAG